MTVVVVEVGTFATVVNVVVVGVVYYLVTVHLLIWCYL